ncbi:MAG TPA: Hsp70 family protein, partial [Polyangiaceae bacterium]
MSVVGIDLGTTNTVVACVRNGRVHVLGDEQGRRLLPSVVSFHPNGDVLVGHAAKARRAVDAKNTVASVKRLLGRAWNSPELEKSRRRFAFEMKEGPGQSALVVARGKEYTIPEIGAYVLKRAREIAENALGEPVERAVITVPAHFNELQRAATKVAGRVAGLEVLRILNEPTAAALAYGLGKGTKERIAIYDFGGGTFDATLLDLNGNIFEVLATAGDPFLGGDDIDDAIADRMAAAFLVQHRFDPRSDGQTLERLRQAAEQVKVALTGEEQAQIHLREIAFGVGGAHLDLIFGLSREELEKMTEPLLERTLKVTQDALALARLAPSEFDRTILVGGTSRMPLVKRRVEAFFGAQPMDKMNPDEVVAIGAAIQAAALTDASRRRSIPPPPAGRKTSPSYADAPDPALTPHPASRP